MREHMESDKYLFIVMHIKKAIVFCRSMSGENVLWPEEGDYGKREF